MRTTISFSTTPKELQKVRKLSRLRGFPTTSDYLRFLIETDDVELITEDELLKRSKTGKDLYKKGELIEAASVKDLLTRYGR